MNPLHSIPAGIVIGVVLAIIVFVIAPGSGFNELSLARWIHTVSGVMWVGLLYYVVVAQIPGLAAAAADKGGPGGAGIWVVIWPNQKKILGVVPATDEQKAAARNTALYATRTNFV